MTDTNFLLNRARAIAGPKASIAVVLSGEHINVRLDGRDENFCIELLARNYDRFGETHADTMWRDEMISSGVMPPLEPLEVANAS